MKELQEQRHDLRELSRWVCWKIAADPSGLLRKQPFNPTTGNFAESDNPETWTDYRTAKDAVASGTYDGFGVALGKDLGLTILDLDHVRDKYTGEVASWASAVIEQLASYTEISVSGTGLHVLVWASIPANLKRGGAEIYDSGKMFVLTGKIYNGHNTIKELDLSDLYAQIETKNLRPTAMVVYSYDDIKFRRCVEDDWGSYFTSRSEAVQSVLVTLAKKHNYDPEKMIAEFETTELHHHWADKWERLQDKEITTAISFAKKSNGGPGTPPPIPFVVEAIDLDTISEIAEPMPRYPVEVWDGTEYAEFADICQRGNFIPPEFFIEAIKTVTGAVVGNNLRIQGLEGGLPRFYSVLINSGGSGKGTAISYACEVFREHWDGRVDPLLWSSVTKVEEVKWKSVGACMSAFSSAPGMQRTAEKGQIRWLQIFEELSSIIESTGIQGSGQSLLAANRQLYDSEYFTTTATAQRDSSAGRAQNTLLAGTTPTLWAEMFSGKQIEGSGLFQRFNIVAADNIQRVGTLLTPDLGDFSLRLSSRVAKLENVPVRFPVHSSALILMNDWFQKVSASVNGEEPDPDDYGRINVLGWRNAIHLAWLKGQKEITAEDMTQILKLCDYQLAMRKKCKPSTGENPTALLEDKIRRIVTEKGKIKVRDARRKLNANRYGITTWDRAVKNLVSVEDIRYAEEKTTSGQNEKWLIRRKK